MLIKKYTSEPHLYLDSRCFDKTLVGQNEFESRLSYLNENRAIRLSFSGRLISIKGADHLIELARVLNLRGLSFEFYIFGDGNLVPLIKDKINSYCLSDMVFLKGAVDFEKELVPYIKSNIDLFVCCHRQRDPSCTDIETYSCGVPIIGYKNRAHQGILDVAGIGWSVPMDDYEEELARKIVYLDEHRDEIKEKARRAKVFSLQHTFEKTFSRRMKHCRNIVGQ